MTGRLLEKPCSDGSSQQVASSVSPPSPQWPEAGIEVAMFRGARSQYFCGQGRSQSPFSEHIYGI